MKLLSEGIVTGLLILALQFICFAGVLDASPIARKVTRKNRSTTCSNLKFICATQAQKFSVPFAYNRKNRRCDPTAKILDVALKECNHSVMRHCEKEWVEKINNCSAPLIKKSLSRVFHGACGLHDLCYNNLNTTNVTRKNCDDWFRHNLRQTCKIKKLRSRSWLTWWGETICKGIAETMYRAVRLFGYRGFKNGQIWAEKYCRKEPEPENSEEKDQGYEASGSGEVNIFAESGEEITSAESGEGNTSTESGEENTSAESRKDNTSTESGKDTSAENGEENKEDSA